MDKFEYFRINDNEIEPLKALFFLEFKDNKDYDWMLQLDGINFLGDDGWELVGIIEQRIQFPELIFKRLLSSSWARSVKLYNANLNEVRNESRKYNDLKYMTKVSSNTSIVL